MKLIFALNSVEESDIVNKISSTDRAFIIKEMKDILLNNLDKLIEDCEYRVEGPMHNFSAQGNWDQIGTFTFVSSSPIPEELMEVGTISSYYDGFIYDPTQPIDMIEEGSAWRRAIADAGFELSPNATEEDVRYILETHFPVMYPISEVISYHYNPMDMLDMENPNADWRLALADIGLEISPEATEDDIRAILQECFG